MEEEKQNIGRGKKSKETSNKVKRYGPVVNLEEYVHPDWWRNIFNSLYLKTDSDVIDDDRITRTEIDLLEEVLTIKKDEKILDLCCGQGRHTLELARRGFIHSEGIDQSRYLIQKAKNCARKEGYSIKFREGDARRLPYANDTFDIVVILGNSFGYFESSQDDIKVMREVFRVLKPWGRFILDVADGDYIRQHFEPRSWEWLDKNHFVCRERSLSIDRQRLISREVITHINKGVVADQFYAERLYTVETLKELLLHIGFSEIKEQKTIKTDSQRNQDLGMMDTRVIISAQVRKEWSKKPSIQKKMKNIVVVMGDPNKPDRLKPDCIFDDDDFYTIDQMKNALRDRKGCHFTYLNNHDTLITDLLKIKPRIDYVLNLCDEGYSNNPRYELHIPSLLEILGIPYTGGNPQCLAFCYDKSLVRGIAKEMTIPVPQAFFIKSEDRFFELSCTFPLIVKPNSGDSSFGITRKSVVYSYEELLNAVSDLHSKFGFDQPVLVEEFLTGKDLTVGIIGNPPDAYMVLPVSEEDYSELPPDLPQICGYEAKWAPDSPYGKIKSIKSCLPEHTEKIVLEGSIKLFERLECRDYARFDWRLDAEGYPRLLEVNPNPGWCWDGHLAKMASFTDINYSKMLDMILRAAEQRLRL